MDSYELWTIFKGPLIKFYKISRKVEYRWKGGIWSLTPLNADHDIYSWSDNEEKGVG